MVPTLTWGLVRSNFPFAISRTPKKIHTNPKGFSAHPEPDAPESGAHGGKRTPHRPPSHGRPFHPPHMGNPQTRTNVTSNQQQPTTTNDAPATNRQTALEREAGIEPASLAWKARV